MDNGEDGPASQEDAAAWADEYGISYPVLHGQSVPDLFDAFFQPWHFVGLGLPAFWIIDPMGEIRAFSMGFNEENGPNFNSKDIQSLFEEFLLENPEWVKPSVDAICSEDTCQNGGTCEIVDGKTTCSCAEGYSGDACETDTDDCAANPCQNGGVCTDAVASYTCNCADTGFIGKTCEQAITVVNGCSNADAKDLTKEAEVTIQWDFSVADVGCVLVSAGTTITFAGNFDVHPLFGGDGNEADPASPFSNHDNGVVTVTEAGAYGFYCALHASMLGAVFVQ